MSEERKKLIWISVSSCVFCLVLIGAGFFLFAPRSGGATAPATIGNISAPKTLNPQDYFSAPPPSATPEKQPTSVVGPDGSTYVIYDDQLIPNPNLTTATSVNPESTHTIAAGSTETSTTALAERPTAAKPQATTQAAPSKPVKTTPPEKTSTLKPTPPKVKADYWIQAASFTSRGRADDLKETLSDKGIAAHITVKDIVGKSWYRVRVGPYATKSEAEGWLERLKKLPQCAEAYVQKGN
jgi:DedD protein